MCEQSNSNGNGHNVIAFLSLEDFGQDVIPVDNLVRVEAINRTLPGGKSLPGGMLQWLVIATALTADGDMAMTSILVGEVWKFAANGEPWHGENAKQAEALTRQYLEDLGFCVGPGVWNPKLAIENIVGGATELWRFEDKQLVKCEEYREV